jgi:hypothetical protein
MTTKRLLSYEFAAKGRASPDTGTSRPPHPTARSTLLEQQGGDKLQGYYQGNDYNMLAGQAAGVLPNNYPNAPESQIATKSPPNSSHITTAFGLPGGRRTPP